MAETALPMSVDVYKIQDAQSLNAASTFAAQISSTGCHLPKGTFPSQETPSFQEEVVSCSVVRRFSFSF